MELPPEKFPLDEAREILNLQRSALSYVHLGAKRSTCRWAVPWRDQHENLFSIVLPEIQQMRSLARILQLEARVALTENRLDDALASIRTGYAAGRHVTTAPLFINGLVGVAITSTMQQELLRVLQHPTAPNLYWSLAALPQPLLDYRPAIEFEGESLFIMFPSGKNSINHARPPNGISFICGRFGRLMKMSQELGAGTGDLMPSLASLAVISPLLYAQAKQHLTEAGMEKAKIDALPMSQAILLYLVQDYRMRRDEIAKWMYLPINELPTLQTLSRTSKRF